MVGRIVSMLVPLWLLAGWGSGELNKDKVVVAINCGSMGAHMDQSEVQYSEDKHFASGVESNKGELFATEWPDFPDIELYYTERWGNTPEFAYDLPLWRGKEDGIYVLVLKFSEVYFDSPSRKIFDIAIGSKTVIKDMDIFARVGKFAPLDEFIEFSIKGKQLYYKSEIVEDGITTNGEVNVRFIKGAADNPKVNGIVLVKGSLRDAGYFAWQEYFRNKEQLRQAKLDRLNAQRTKEINRLLDTDEDLDLSSLGKTKDHSRYDIVAEKNMLKQTIASFLDIPFALEVLCIAFVMLVFFVFTFLWKPRKQHKEDHEKRDQP